MIIIVDIDDTLGANLMALLDLYNSDWDDNKTPEDIVRWELADQVKPECGVNVYNYFARPDFYDYVEPIPGALDAVNALRERGHELIFLTAAAHPGKGPWLVEHGFVEDTWDLPEYACMRDKSRVLADLIIDDKPETVENYPGFGILFDRPHNQHYKPSGTKYRAMNWEEVIQIVDRLEKMGSSARSVLNKYWAKQPDLGVGPDAPTVVNENGGKQSEIKYAPTLADPLVLLNLFNILYEGAVKYGKWNWRRIELTDQLDHAFTHMYAWLAGDRSDDHLGHALARLHFAKSLEITPGESERMNPE